MRLINNFLMSQNTPQQNNTKIDQTFKNLPNYSVIQITRTQVYDAIKSSKK